MRSSDGLFATVIMVCRKCYRECAAAPTFKSVRVTTTCRVSAVRCRRSSTAARSNSQLLAADRMLRIRVMHRTLYRRTLIYQDVETFCRTHRTGMNSFLARVGKFYTLAGSADDIAHKILKLHDTPIWHSACIDIPQLTKSLHLRRPLGLGGTTRDGAMPRCVAKNWRSGPRAQTRLHRQKPKQEHRMKITYRATLCAATAGIALLMAGTAQATPMVLIIEATDLTTNATVTQVYTDAGTPNTISVPSGSAGGIDFSANCPPPRSAGSIRSTPPPSR